MSKMKQEHIMKDHQHTETAKQIIAEALEECLKTKRLEKVTVSEIMKKADMTRQMFYYYFQDINELVYWMHCRHTIHHTANFFEQRDFVKAFGNALMEMQEHKDFYKNIITYEEYPTFSDSFYQEVLLNVEKYIGKGRIDEDLDFAMKLYWTGATKMLVEWIKNDMKTPPYLLAQRFYANMPQRLVSYYD